MKLDLDAIEATARATDDTDTLLVPEEVLALIARIRQLELKLSIAETSQERVVSALEERKARHRRAQDRIRQLEASLVEACDLYKAAECVGPTRYEPERIAELRALVQP